MCKQKVMPNILQVVKNHLLKMMQQIILKVILNRLQNQVSIMETRLGIKVM